MPGHGAEHGSPQTGDINAPQRLDAATTQAFGERDDLNSMNRRIDYLTLEIARKPQLHKELAAQRTKLCSRKSKSLEVWKKEFVQNWWHTAYDEYISGSEFKERNMTCLFNIYEKYLPERARLSESLFTKTSLDSVVGQTCLEDMAALCTSTERVVCYPGLFPEDNRCPTRSKLASQ